jgi:hypothetical protein
MKYIPSLALLAILLPTFILGIIGCDSTATTTNKDGSVTTKSTTANNATINNIAGLAFQAAQLYINSRGGNPIPSTVPSNPSLLAFNDLSGLAAQAQANLGKTPLTANVAQGASTSAVGNTIMANLPKAPMTQDTVTTLTDAAARVKTL